MASTTSNNIRRKLTLAKAEMHKAGKAVEDILLTQKAFDDEGVVLGVITARALKLLLKEKRKEHRQAVERYRILWRNARSAK